MQKTKDMQLSQICPRFVPPPPTDWTRVGYGGDGVDKKSGHFAPDQFQTTNSKYFAPLHYVPNQPVKRHVSSDAEMATLHKRNLIALKAVRQKEHMEMVQDRSRAAEVVQAMDADQRLRNKAEQMHSYYKQTYENDMKLLAKQAPDTMQKRSHPELAKKHWNGSPANPLHLDRRRELHKENPLDWRTTNMMFGSNLDPKVAQVKHLGHYLLQARDPSRRL